MANTQIADFEALLKDVYTPDYVADVSLKTHPTLSMIKRTQSGTVEDNLVTALIYGESPARSATATTSIANAGAGRKKARFVQGSYKDYNTCEVPRILLKGTQSDMKSLLTTVAAEFDQKLVGLGDSMAHALFRNGTGCLSGPVDVSGSTVTVANVADMRFIFTGLLLQASNNDGTDPGHTLLDGGDTITVTGVNREAGTFTFSGTITGFGNGDYIFASGDFQNKFAGFDAFIPGDTSTAPATLYGLDRSVDWDRLGGVRLNCSNIATVKDAITQLRMRLAVYANSSKANTIVIHPTQWARLETELGSAVRYGQVSAEGVEFGFRSIEYMSSRGGLNILADSDCGPTDIWCLDLSTWEFASVGPAPEVQNDGGQILRSLADDVLQIRASYYGSLRCFAPGLNARGYNLPAA
jgi:hypothetical protein